MVERADAQLVVHTFNEEENLILFNSEFVFRVWLGFVVVGCLEEGKVSFWIVGHEEGWYQVEVTVVIRSAPFASIPTLTHLFLACELCGKRHGIFANGTKHSQELISEYLTHRE